MQRMEGMRALWRVAPGSILILALISAVVCAGCGLIADKDRIRVAKVDNEYITRGDLDKVVRDLPSEERNIQTRGDLLQVLENHVNSRVKAAAAAPLQAEGKIHVPIEVARASYDAKHPESLSRIADPDSYGLTKADIEFYEQQREISIEREQKRLLGEQAVYFLIAEAVKDGVLTISDEEYAREFEVRKYQLVHPEEITVHGPYFPETISDAAAIAVRAKRRLESGENVYHVAEEHAGQGAGELNVRLENVPGDPKFVPFWQQASGTETGAVMGPIFIQGWVKQEMTLQGKVKQEALPDSYFVFNVLDYKPQREKTLEEAKPELQRYVLYSKMVERLREQHGVEIYEDRLPDPSVYERRSLFKRGG